MTTHTSSNGHLWHSCGFAVPWPLHGPVHDVAPVRQDPVV